MLHHYQFHSQFHHIHQHNCKCNRLLGQCSFLHFDKGLWHIHQYLKKLLQLGGKVCYLSVINIQSRFSNICLGIYNKFEMMLHYYQFHSWFHHIREDNCKRNRLFGQCNSHRFDKGLWRIHQCLRKEHKGKASKTCDLFYHFFYVMIP